MKFLVTNLKFKIVIFFVLFFVFSPYIVKAITKEEQDRCDKLKASLNITITNDQLSSWQGNVVDGLPTYCSAQDIVTVLLRYLFAVSGTAAALFIILGGFWYMTSAGNEEQAEKGQKTITYAIIGLVVVIMSYTIVRITTGIFFTDLPDSPNIKKDEPEKETDPVNNNNNIAPGTSYSYEPWLDVVIPVSIEEGNNLKITANFEQEDLDLFKEFCSGAAPENVSLVTTFDGRARGISSAFRISGLQYVSAANLEALKPIQNGDTKGFVEVSICNRKIGGGMINFTKPDAKIR